MSLLDAINKALSLASQDCLDKKQGSCSVANCPNDAIAKGFCNAHYIRNKKGLDLEKPLKTRSKNCIDCGEPRNSKGGWLRCSKHFKLARQKTIKEAAVKEMGNKCQNCGQSFPLSVYDFHHVGSKNADPSYLIANSSIENISKELEGCILLCANCHRIEHEKLFC